MTIIAPSILSANFLELGQEIKRLEKAKNLWIHLDIMDGHFVPNLTFGATVLKNLKDITSHKLDAHLMVTNPEDYIESFSPLGLENFTFHWEAVTHHDGLIQELKKHFPSVGISLNPSTPIEAVPEYLFEKIDLVLIMSVNPGFGGQKFISSSLDKIKQLSSLKKEKGYQFQIQVDGGVTDKNAKSLVRAGAINLVAGSYIFNDKEQKYLDRIEKLRES